MLLHRWRAWTALDAVRAVLADLGINEADLTTELYTDAVAAART
ncbi:hypothetical protein ACGF13_35445 [Kitasatospora sp. NPDC048286]